MVKYAVQKIYGAFKSGVVLDVHTLSSTYLGVNEAGHEVYDTTRSEVGELLYRLKYASDEAAGLALIETASAFLAPHKSKFDLIVPVPPSGARHLQPVLFLAAGIGKGIGLPVANCVATTRATQALKGVQDPEKRKELLDGLHDVDQKQTAGKNILLFDDLYRSGATMNAITEVLLDKGQAASVRAFAITKTRSKT